MALEVATYAQILTILSHLAENYTNLFDVYYEMFYSDIPADVELLIYDENGQQQTIVLPNRAKDRVYILNGNGNPNNVVSANKGAIYQDLENGSLYLNIDGTISGWSVLVLQTDLSDIIIQGGTNPEGSVTAKKGVLYTDTQNGVLYIKTTETGNTGWLDISAVLEDISNRNLSNLTPEGEAHFSNPSLSNLNNEGEAKFKAKENVANKVTVLSSLNTDIQYPSAKAVYNALITKENLVNKTTDINSSSTDIQYPSAKAVYTALASKEDLSNKTTGISPASTDTQYPSAKAVYNEIDYLNNLKVNRDFSNANPTSDFATTLRNVNIVTVVDSYVDGESGYIIYSNKLCEQWGVHSSGNTVHLLKAYANTRYNIICQDNTNNVGTNSNAQGVYDLTKTQFSILYWNKVFWRTIGYMA